MALKHFSKWTERKEALYFLLCFSALLKLSITLSNNVINSDGILYIAAAQEFAIGHFSEGLALFPLPLYSYLLSVIHNFVPNWIIAARFISITTLVLSVIPLYLLTNDLFDRKAAFWAITSHCSSSGSNKEPFPSRAVEAEIRPESARPPEPQ